MTTSSSSVSFYIGNTYRSILPANAKFDKSHQFRRVHDWTVYVDVVGNDADVVDRIVFDMGPSFSPRSFTHHCPVRQSNSHWRFQSRQQSYAMIACEITIHGRGGSTLKLRHQVRRQDYREPQPRRFVESRPQKTLGPVPLSNERFGLELELTTSRSETPQTLARAISQQGPRVHVLVSDYAEARRHGFDQWKLMSDSSIQCHVNRPDCHGVELVSPILVGNDGLNECSRVLEGLNALSSIKVNKSMGFHVHVNVANIGRKALCKICQNFIKYEEAMDSIMPPSRRNNKFCKSNKMAVGGRTNKERHKRLALCKSVHELCAVMNPGKSRYYKLNLENLRTKRQPTLEFRQHSATVHPLKVLNWIRVCLALVHNSSRLAPPSPLKESRTPEEQLEMMFAYAVKDRYLAKFYRQRRVKLLTEEQEDGHCCDGCAGGGVCTASRPVKRIRN